MPLGGERSDKEEGIKFLQPRRVGKGGIFQRETAGKERSAGRSMFNWGIMYWLSALDLPKGNCELPKWLWRSSK